MKTRKHSTPFPSELDSLSDENLMAEFLASPSVEKLHIKVQTIIHKKFRIKKAMSERITKTLVPLFIPQGTKASVRGKRLNADVSTSLRRSFQRSAKHRNMLELKFEYMPVECKGVLHDRPDWILRNLKTGTLIIGYNQIALWGGGQQLNRGAKYVLDETLHTRLKKKNVHVLSVVHEQPPSRKHISTHQPTKTEQIACIGVAKKRLCHVRDMKNILRTLLNI